jgi:hypothetical protein
MDIERSPLQVILGVVPEEGVLWVPGLGRQVEQARGVELRLIEAMAALRLDPRFFVNCFFDQYPARFSTVSNCVMSRRCTSMLMAQVVG